MLMLGTAAILLAAALSPATAAAQADDFLGGWQSTAVGDAQEPVRFTLEGGEPFRILKVVGAFDAGASARLQTAIAAVDIEEVWLNSTGGDAAEAMSFGRLLKRSGVATRIPTGAVCVGACAEAFLGGVARFVEEGGRLGFSGVPSAEPAAGSAVSPEQAGARWAEQRADYYIRAGVSRGLLRLQLEGEADRICFLSPSGLQRYNVTNARLPLGGNKAAP